jgi:hypothetical protein
MKDSKLTPETPPLTRAGRKVAEAALARAQFKATADGKRASRQFEVHGIAVTEIVTAEDAMPTLTARERVAGPHVGVRATAANIATRGGTFVRP